jgi:cytochrome c biogenesis protein CcdA
MENITFISLFVIGFSYGATACMFSCMPFLAPLLITNSNSFYESSKVVLPFSLGRIFTYTLIAIAASFSSVMIKSVLNNNQLFQLLLGAFTLLMGLLVLFRVFKTQKSCSSASHADQGEKSKSAVGLFMIGALVSLNPCAPILTLITLSANTTSFLSSVLYGGSFGLGAVLVPFLFYTFFVGNIFRGLIEQFRKYMKLIEIFAASLLIVTGIMVFAGKISL